jgi:triosephosphate isomerase
MLSSIKVDHCIVGHSERRAMFGDTNDIVAQKARSCFDSAVIPIVCCGETLDQRESGRYFDIVTEQVNSVLKQLKDHEAEKMIIAYEPVWAIGTGKTASSAQAQDMHEFIRKSIALHFSDAVAQKVRILYGGSVKPDNAAELFSQPDVDGGLVGGASLKYESFKAIFEAAF